MSNNIVPSRGLAGRFGGQGAFPAETPAPATTFTRVSEAEAKLRTSLAAAIGHLAGDEEVPEDAPEVFATLDAVKAYRKRSGIDIADLISSLPRHMRNRLRVIRLRQD